MSVTPKKADQYGNYAHGMYYTDFCRYCRDYEKSWTAQEQNRAWERFAKECD